MKYTFKYIMFFILMATLAGCSTGENAACNDLDVTCSRAASAKLSVSPGEVATAGDELEFDASDSIYDTIRWTLDEVAYGDCNHSDLCEITFDTAGVYVVGVETKINATGQITLGVTGTPESEDSTSMVITVNAAPVAADTTASSTSSSSTEEDENVCIEGESYSGGIVIKESGGDCVIMATKDGNPSSGSSGKCRYNGTGWDDCINFSQAQGACPAGVTAGSQWYIPNITELQWAYAQRGTGSPVTSNGFCTSTVTSPCSTGGGYTPGYYWSRTDGTADDSRKMLVQGAIVDNEDESNVASVRCVKRVSL